MKKTINMVFENCTIDGDVIIENGRDEAWEHSIMAVFRQLDGESGLTITIKKTTKSGEIRDDRSDE